MPTRPHFQTAPMPLSIVQYDLNRDEEPFLAYRWGCENGPGLVRPGDDSPYMAFPDGEPGKRTTDPDGQRLSSWLIDESLREDDRHKAAASLLQTNADLDQAQQDQAQAIAVLADPDVAAEARIAAEKRKRDAERRIKDAEHRTRIYTIWLSQISRIDAFDRTLIKAYGKKNRKLQIVGQGGWGDLTMNFWNVAFISGPMVQGGRRLLFLNGEPLSDRIYSCFIKWNANSNIAPNGKRVSIEDVRFDAFAVKPNEKVFVYRNGNWTPCANDIEFAASNQQVVRDGQVTRVDRLLHQFADLRHMIRMPNLNPMDRFGAMYPGDPMRPRTYFGAPKYDDVWLGEKQMVDDLNLQRAAISGPVFINRIYGGLSATIEQTRGALTMNRYKEVTSATQELQPGDFRFVAEDNRLVEIYFLQNKYAWTMIGVNMATDAVLHLACEANLGAYKGYFLKEAAQILADNGAYNALLVDEGQDVFQVADLGLSGSKIAMADGSDLDILIPVTPPTLYGPFGRTRMRAKIFFAKE